MKIITYIKHDVKVNRKKTKIGHKINHTNDMCLRTIQKLYTLLIPGWVHIPVSTITFIQSVENWFVLLSV